MWGGLVLAITVASLMPNFGPPSDFNVDKILHFLGYGAAAGLPFLGFRRNGQVWTAAFAMAPLGIVLEVLQDAVPGRMADTNDAIANLVGVALGMTLGPLARSLVHRWFAPGH